MGTKARVFLVLFAFWIIISERLQWDSLLVGIVCTVGVIFVNRDLLWERKELPRFSLHRVWIMICLLGNLIVEIIKANLEVVRIVLSPKIECTQGIVVFCPTIRHSWLRVMLANAITLTPGTLTLDIEDDCFVVHLLDMRNADSLLDWRIVDKFHRMEDE